MDSGMKKSDFLTENLRYGLKKADLHLTSIPVKDVKELAFDHNQILEASLAYIRQYVDMSPAVLFDLLPRKFTAAQLRRVYEIVYDRVSEEYRRGMNDASDFTAWMKHRLVLKNATVAELKLRISQLYHKDLVFEQGVLSGICLSASFNASCSLENVLDVISELYGVDYKEENDRVIFYK